MRKISITYNSEICDANNLGKYLLEHRNNNTIINIIPFASHIEYEISVRSLSANPLYEKISKAICMFILHDMRKGFMLDYAKSKAEILNAEEYSSLLKRLGKLFETPISAQEYLCEQIKSVLIQYKTLSVDGFFRFRMRKEQAIWKTGVDMIADDIILEREYDNFIELMKVFLEVQVPKADVVHVFVHNGTLKIFDENLNAYDTRRLKEIAVDMTCAPVCDEDITVSVLLALAPRVIIIHNDSGDEPAALKTIKRVFDTRICSD
ncbi:MAG TPA: sporulation protein YtxC [Clostridia bacterium]|nr:sporulation protein YtxC [Clostridia bacterium]